MNKKLPGAPTPESDADKRVEEAEKRTEYVIACYEARVHEMKEMSN